MYYRDADKFEVDFDIENTQGNLVGVEVKASATDNQKDFKELKKLASLDGNCFKIGLLLNDETEKMPLADNIWAAPL